jgi:RNA polymerase sigma-70 factor (ECF subfamily)
MAEPTLSLVRVEPGADPEEAARAASLVARIHAGEHAAEGELVTRYRSGLVALLRHWTRDRSLAEDLAQEALLVAIERLRSRPLDDAAKLGAFLRGTAHNLAVATRRREIRRQTSSASDLIDGFVDATADPLAAAERAQEAHLIHRLIGELTMPRDRDLLYRHYVAGEPKSRICEELGLDAVHFNRVLYRARVRLRELLDPNQGGR